MPKWEWDFATGPGWQRMKQEGTSKQAGEMKDWKALFYDLFVMLSF
eukprot:CAMPEP_0184046052 /NCGR_PEP_ID=MMETSP0956-20121227/1298_1 /TAXON_ID=627963 /ORGANISM="Aplanochytrium sp, Strain PBS07" /LENGTH=45 /DNA_ID= /DNA_START= /DNA_END= /DNA_ORIENTATION=